jgi:galactokinase
VSKTRRSYFVPGRIEFLGKHTDYAGGRSLVCAIERGITLHAAPRGDALVTIRDAGSGERGQFEISPALSPPTGHWTAYPMTVARRLARNFPRRWQGADIEFTSNLPRDAGLSSSSALIVASHLALADANDLAPFGTLEELAGYLGAVESGAGFGNLAGDQGVGTTGGSEDHVAILCSRPDQLGQYAFSPVRPERQVALPRECVFVVAVSGVAAPKTGAAREQYNRASRQAGELLERWRLKTGRRAASLAQALRSSPGAAGDMRALVAQEPALRDRLEQFLAESEEIVPAAGDALLRGDLGALGPLVDRSQALAERCLGNQVPETILLARAARDLGAAAASAFGAGFGGSVWALVGRAASEDFRRRWAKAYRDAFPSRAEQAVFFLTGAGPGMRRL